MVPENIHSPTTEGVGISREAGRGVCRVKDPGIFRGDGAGGGGGGGGTINLVFRCRLIYYGSNY